MLFENGREKGTAQHFYDDGKLAAEAEFKYGRLIHVKEYDKKGVLIDEKFDENGLPREGDSKKK